MRTRVPSIRSNLIILALAAAAVAPATVATPQAIAAPPPCQVDVNRELWIRDLSVVNDPVRTQYVENPTDPAQGAWSFGRLIENLAPGIDPTEMVLHLFDQMEHDQTVNGFLIPGREGPRMTLLEPWIANSPGFYKGEGLDFNAAPFRLMGIVNRLDLRSSSVYGQETGGEGRIVFCGITENGDATLFTIIFEYELLSDGCTDVKSWAKAFHALGQIPFGPTFNAALQSITDAFSGPGVAPGRPNDSALNQLRTNELLADFPWQWREYHLSPASGLLDLGTVAQTPQTTLLGTSALADYINQNEAQILAGEHVVPPSWAGQPFLGGASDGTPFFMFWDAPGILNNEARHRFSLLTCNSCHTSETDTSFFHAMPRQADQVTGLSNFLLGESILDPVDPTVKRQFNDLKRRAKDLCSVIDSSCATLSAQKPLARVH